MLNISTNSIKERVSKTAYSALNRVEKKVASKVLIKILKWGFLLLFICAFLPWTQNVNTSGNVSTLRPDQRPQTIQTVIAGRIDKWFIQEGDFVRKSDTIAVISEVKDAYFDNGLIDRTSNQLELKKRTADTYGEKELTQDKQLGALSAQLQLESQQLSVKLEQARLKVMNDSISYFSAQLNALTAHRQLERMDSLYQQGLKSLVDLEARRIKQQQTFAYEIEAKNKWLNSKNDMVNLRLELRAINSKYDNNYAKVLSEKMTTSTNRYDAESMINKLENQVVNYKVRQGYYYIIAPQDGYVTKIFVAGLGETVKEGQKIVSIMPENYDLSVEIYVDPIDLPLLHKGEIVRVRFDGWPAIVFSGWPNISYGTYGGEIYAIDQYISENGKFRILVKPAKNDHAWPSALRYGGGVRAMILLEDVPIWYEMWRKINGFPPNFYTPQKLANTKK